MELQSQHHFDPLRLLSHDQAIDDVESNRATWSTMDQEPGPVDEGGLTKLTRAEIDREEDGLVAQYVGDVRHFNLLTRAEEEALWQRIEHLKKGVRRALYTAPVCLSTLQMLGREVVEGDRLLHDVIAATSSIAEEALASDVSFEAAILALQALMQRLQRLKRRKRSRGGDSIEARRARRQACADWWRQWIATCEALQLQPAAHEALRHALEAALLERPNHLALRAACSAWSRSNHALEEAKADMLRANLRLVIYMAKRFRSDEVAFLDLIQEGNIGLMRALDKFDSSRGIKFATYAYWWVRQAIGRAVHQQSRTIRLPVHVVEQRNKLRAAASKLWEVHKRAPTVRELGGELGWRPQAVEALQSAQPVMIRLHEPLSEDGRLLEESVEDGHALKPDVVAAQWELQEKVADSLCGLADREANILRLRFGLDTGRAHSLKEIGDLYGLSRERIRQLEAIALTKLRGSGHFAWFADFGGVGSPLI